MRVRRPVSKDKATTETKTKKPRHPPPQVPHRKLSKKTEARIAEKIARVLELKSQGWSRADIAKELGVDPKQVARWWERAYAEYIADHRVVRDAKFAEILAGHEMMIRQWSDAASKPYTKKGAAAALIVLRARREISKMCGHGNSVTVAMTGAEGGPIVTVNATPMEHARMVREQFKMRALGAGAAVATSPASPVTTPSTSNGNGAASH